MSFKRSASQMSTSNIGTQNKKSKNIDRNNCLHSSLRESGLTLNHPPAKCIASHKSILIISNIKRNLKKHFDYPRNVSELFVNLEKECQDIEIFKHYLYPNIVMIEQDSVEEHPLNDSVLKILLSIPILQNKIVDYIFEKAIDLAAQSKCGPWIQTILKCLSTLDSIVASDKMATHLINLLDIANEKMVRLEIITAIPRIVGDQEHNNIASEMSRILSEDHELIPAILECLTYLCLSDEQYGQLQKKTLSILASLSKYNYFPNFVKFLLIPGQFSDDVYVEAVQGLRNALGWSTSLATAQEIASSQVLTIRAIRNSMVSSKLTANAWLKAVSMCKVHIDHKPIDFIILLTLFSTSQEKQTQVENLIRKQIKSNTLKEDLLDETFDKFKPILKDSLKHLIDLANTMLKMKGDLAVESFASHIYTLMFAALEDCCQTIVAELLQLGLDSKQCVMNILTILNNVALKDMSLLKPQSVQMLQLLDRTNDMSLTEMRATMNLLCGLAYSYENSLIRDDIHMVIRKKLSSSNPAMKIQGILAGVHAVKFLMVATTDDDETREMANNISHGTISQLPEGDLREAAQIIEMISCSTTQLPDMTAFFYDELTKVLSSASSFNKNIMSWLTDAVTNDLKQNFVVDSLDKERIGDLKLIMQYCLNADSEMNEIIAINVAGLTLQNKSEVSICILSPLFQLVQTLHYKQSDGDLSSIDALLGCPIVLPKFNIDEIEDMDQKTIGQVLDCLVHTVNWFRELLNAFTTQNDDALKVKLLKRLCQIDEIQVIISEILIKSKISYKPPICTLNINKYVGEQMQKTVNQGQNSKQKSLRRANEETIIPETLRTQATQNSSVKNKLDVFHNIPFRQFNLNLTYLLSTDLSNNDDEHELNVKSLTFLLNCINSSLEDILISKIKRQTFLTKQSNNTTHDVKKAEYCAKLINERLPKIMKHLEFITLYIDNHSSATDDENESGLLYTSELIEYLACLENIYKMLTIYFKWIGFRNNTTLLKTSLRTVACSDNAIISLNDLLIAVAEQFKNHQKYCLQLSTAVSLVEFLKTIQSYCHSKNILKILKHAAHDFLSKQWKTPDGALEKGLFFNQSVDNLASIYFINNEILELKKITLQLTQDIKLLNSRNDTLQSFKCISKNNFPILYRNLGTALYESTKVHLNKGMTNSEHLGLWKDVVSVLKYMSDIAKTLENRNNLSAFFKKSQPVLKLFLSQAIPMIEMQFKNETQEVIEILKTLQQSTRFLQTLCCHSRLKNDKAIMSKVPTVRQLLETLIYKVKAALAANNSSEVFWMGNLKNKDIHGEVIATQQDVDEESLEDCDEQLPEDDDSDNSDDDDVINPDSRSLSDIV